MAFATDVTTPPELLTEDLTLAVAPEPPAATLPTLSVADVSISEQDLPAMTSASALQSSFVGTPDLDITDDPDTNLEDNILPLTGIRKTYDDIPADLDGQCKGLMTDLGIAPDNVQKLCNEGFYGPIRELKDAFTTALEWYKNRLAELDADESELNALVVNPATQPSIRTTGQQSLQVLKEQREKVSAAYQGLLSMNELVSRGVDAFDEIRKQLLAALYVLQQRLQQGGLDPQDLNESQRAILTQTALDQQLQSQLGSSESGAPLEAKIAQSVNEVLATESESESKSANEITQTLPSITAEEEKEENAESDVEDEEVLL